jgi:hypothetical protein
MAARAGRSAGDASAQVSEGARKIVTRTGAMAATAVACQTKTRRQPIRIPRARRTCQCRIMGAAKNGMAIQR